LKGTKIRARNFLIARKRGTATSSKALTKNLDLDVGTKKRNPGVPVLPLVSLIGNANPILLQLFFQRIFIPFLSSFHWTIARFVAWIDYRTDKGRLRQGQIPRQIVSKKDSKWKEQSVAGFRN